MDYFSFRFYDIDKNEREEYMGSGAMYEFQLKMNPKKHRTVLHNKIAFLKKFEGLSGRKWTTLDIIKNKPEVVESFLSNATGKIVLKYSKGQSGKQVAVCETAFLTPAALISKMEDNNYDLMEEYVIQHDALMKLSSSAVNTVRIVTQYHNGEVIIVTSRLRISINSPVDNASVGNTVVPLDSATGKVIGPGIYADITKPDEFTHPVTGVDFIGFQVPFWKECIQLAKDAALKVSENRSIGWDIAITNNCPILIEGNHNWHYLVLQMPEKKGYKKALLQYLQ
ncbi:MAG: sugar-transfer associated ATP-grasp domain-containing protein [Agriterribacter sp.]